MERKASWSRHGGTLWRPGQDLHSQGRNQKNYKSNTTEYRVLLPLYWVLYFCNCHQILPLLRWERSVRKTWSPGWRRWQSLLQNWYRCLGSTGPSSLCNKDHKNIYINLQIICLFICFQVEVHADDCNISADALEHRTKQQLKNYDLKWNNYCISDLSLTLGLHNGMMFRRSCT